jgi:1,4-dihydroxy-2-naphthoyl-CoA hydrolase
MQETSKQALLSKTVGLDETLGITYEKLDPDEVIATMAITPQHLQPFGYLHGGASLVLAESAASVGGNLRNGPGKVAFGMEINANHLRPKREGTLRAVARPVFAGRSSQVWEVKIYDERERIICMSRCTLAILDAE